jgi:hypothetical protein
VSEVLVPLIEGRMIGQFDYSEKCYVQGSGRSAIWRENKNWHKNRECPRNPLSERDQLEVLLDERIEGETKMLSRNLTQALLGVSKAIVPHYLVKPNAKNGHLKQENLKVGYLAVGASTNARTMIASSLHLIPCGNSVPVFELEGGLLETLGLTACLNSFVFDYCLRMRLTGNNINYFLLQECPLPRKDSILAIPQIGLIAASLNLLHVRYARQWRELSASCKTDLESSFCLATSQSDRLILRSRLDALISHTYDLSVEELEWILRSCNPSQNTSKHQTDNKYPERHAKGFWRCQKDLAPQERLVYQTIRSYHEIKDYGLKKFTAQTKSIIKALHEKQLGGSFADFKQEQEKALIALESNLSRIIDLASS